MSATATLSKMKDPSKESNKSSKKPPSIRKPAAKQSHPLEIINRVRKNPGSMTRDDLMQLHKTIGNQAVAKFLSELHGSKKAQTKEKPTGVKKEGEKAQVHKENKTGMPHNLKAGLETMSGMDMSDVCVHHNSNKPEKVGALAYTHGTDIHLGPGQEKHLPHEGWHAVQQKQGRVKPTIQMKTGVHINDDTALEKEADSMGRKAATIQRYSIPTKTGILKTNTMPVIQGFNLFKTLKKIGKGAWEATKVVGEVALAGVTGGASIVMQIGFWLVDTLPGLFQKAKSVMEFVNTIRNIKPGDIKQFMSQEKIAGILVKGLFGELGSLPVGKKVDGKEKEPAGGKEEKGLLGLLHKLTGVFNTIMGAYSKVAEAINKVLSVMNISKKPWFDKFSMVYAGTVKAVETIENPGQAINNGAEGLKGAASKFFDGIKSRVTDTAKSIKDKLSFIENPGRIMTLLANKAVDMVLNFIITHPPSTLIKTAFKVIEAASGQSIVDLVRKHIPMADKLLSKIADSNVVQGLLKPLQKPVSYINGAINDATLKAVVMVKIIETRTLAAIGNGATLIKQLAGVSGGSKQGGKAQKGGGDFLSVIKSGIHTHLMNRGQELLKKNILKTGKNMAKKVKGIILSKMVHFKMGSESHKVWVEKQGSQKFVMMASEEKKIMDGLKGNPNLPEKTVKQVGQITNDIQSNKHSVGEIDARLAEIAKKLNEESKGGGKAANDLGKLRTQRVAEITGGTITEGATVKTSLGITDIDVTGPNGEVIEVGGPAKANDLGKFKTQLLKIREIADSRGVPAQVYLEEGTPQKAIDKAKETLGEKNVFTFALK